MRTLKLLICFLALLGPAAAIAQTDPRVAPVDSAMRRPGTPPGPPDSPAVKKPVQAKKPAVVKDSARLALERYPRESAFRSLAVPGLGQIHNKRYWKLPFVYGGYVTLGIIYNFDQHNYRWFLHELQYRLANDRQPRDPQLERYSFENLVAAKDYYRRNRDLCILGFVAWHAIQTLDALVDAKMFRFDVTPDLAIHLKPSLEPVSLAAGGLPVPAMKLSMKF